jgi:hypothetical protein
VQQETYLKKLHREDCMNEFCRRVINHAPDATLLNVGDLRSDVG